MLIAAADVLKRYGRWRAPDPARAAAALRGEHAHQREFSVWGSRLHDLREFGAGHLLYFHFLAWNAWLFAALFLFAGLPQAALSAAGRYYPSEASPLASSSLGAFGRISEAHAHDGAAAFAAATDGRPFLRERNITLAFLSDGTHPPATRPFDKRAAITAMGALDTAAGAAFLIASLALIAASRRLAARADRATVTIHDYSVRVGRVPGDASPDELAAHFSRYGGVVRVEAVRAYGTLLGLVLRRGLALAGLKHAVAKLQRAAEARPTLPAAMEDAVARAVARLARLTKRIEEEQAEAGTRRVVAAFVTFKEEAGKLACLAAHPRSRLRQLLTLRREHKFRGRHALTVCDAPEPSDVKYENAEAGALERALRRAATAALQYLSLALGFALVSVASAARVSGDALAGIDRGQCTASCSYSTAAGALALSDADRARYTACAAVGRLAPPPGSCAGGEALCYRCYCSDALQAGMLSEARFCVREAGLIALGYAATGLNVAGILGINALLVACARALTLFERHRTRSQEARSLAVKLFLGQFLNSAVSTVLANAHLPALQRLVAGTRVQAILFQGVHVDLTPNWYRTVGASVLASQLVATAIRAGNVVLTWLLARWRAARSGAALTQGELTDTLRGHQFDLDWRYGQHLSVIYVAMLLSAGLPAAYLSAALWFAACYWLEKAELLKLSRRPVAYGGDLSEAVTGLVPYAVIFHFLFATWAFSFFGTPPSRLATPMFAEAVRAAASRLEPLWRGASGLNADLAARRLLSATGLPPLAALAAAAGFLAVRLTVALWASAGCALLALVWVRDGAGGHGAEASGAPEFGVALRTKLLVGGDTYAIQRQPGYEAAFGRPGDDDGGGGGDNGGGGGRGGGVAAIAAAGARASGSGVHVLMATGSNGAAAVRARGGEEGGSDDGGGVSVSVLLQPRGAGGSGKLGTAGRSAVQSPPSPSSSQPARGSGARRGSELPPYNDDGDGAVAGVAPASASQRMRLPQTRSRAQVAPAGPLELAGRPVYRGGGSSNSGGGGRQRRRGGGGSSSSNGSEGG